MRRTVLVALATGMIASGCTLLPKQDYNRENIITKANVAHKELDVVTLDQSRLLAVGWRDTLASAAVSKREQMQVAEEVLYYGTLLFAGAQSAIVSKGAGTVSRDLIHARNLGGAAAMGSTLFSGHYKVAEQQPVFEKATARMRCVTDALAPIRKDVKEQWSTAVFDTLQGPDNTSIRALYDDVPKQVVEFVERKSLPDLRAALAAITVGMPTRAELTQAISEYESKSSHASSDAPQLLASAATTTYNQNIVVANAALPRDAKNNLVLGVQFAPTESLPPGVTQDPEAQRKFVIAVATFTSALNTCALMYTQ